MSHTVKAFVIAGTLASWPMAAHAEAEGKDIVVTASGFAQSRDDVGQAISIIDRERLDTLQASTVADALREVPGVAVATSGGPGSATSLFIRGANSSQSLVLIDGVRINDPSTPNGFFDFGALLTGNVSRVEVLRGPNSVIWGSQAIGGVVDIRNAEPTERLSVTGRAEYGSRDSFTGTANISGRAGIAGFSLGGGHYRTDGISARTNNDERDAYRNTQANARLTLDLADGIMADLRGYYNHGKVMADDGFALPSQGSDPRSDNEQYVLYAGLNADLLNGRFRNRIAYTRTDVDRVGTDPYTDAFTPISYNVFHAEGQVDRFEYRGAFDISDAISLTFGAEHERTEARNRQPANAPFSPVLQELVSKVTSEYGQLSMRPVTGLTVSGGVRHDDYDLYGGVTTFGANMAYTPDEGRTLLRATYAEGFRAPTMVDLLLPYGNPALKPEESKSWDIGVERSLIGDALRLSATWFHRRSHNLIVLDSFYTPQNIGSARAQGLEVQVVMQPTQALTARFAYSYTDAKEDTAGSATFTGRQLARRPRHRANAAIDWTSPWGLKLGASAELRGDSYDSDFGTARIDGFALAGLRASYPVTGQVELFGRVENLFDARYSTALGYGTTGRSAFGGIRVKY